MAGNPLSAYADEPWNPLSSAGPAPAITAATAPTPADAATYNAQAAQAWLRHQQAISAAMGLADPETGLPTKAGVIEAVRQTANGIMMGTTAPEMRLPGSQVAIPIRPATENVQRAMDASFVYGKDLGHSTMPIDQLSGGVALDNPKQAAKVAALKDSITGRNGYISRPIVDTDGNVIEGQHRLEALRQLGATDVPVHVIKDLGANIDTDAMTAAVRGAQKMHPDQSKQLIGDVLGSVHEEGAPAAVRDAYDPPPGYEKAWNAALDFLDRPSQ